MNDNHKPSIEVYVATHKKIDFALPDYCKKIQVNAERLGQWEGYLHDNDNREDNISLKNPNYCELTALYSMWKNCKADIQGLFHYRRYISRVEKVRGEDGLNTLMTSSRNICKFAITQDMIINALKNADVICVRPFRNAFPILEERKQYCYWHDIRELNNVIREYYPDYTAALQHVYDNCEISACNMFIAGREIVNGYCTWMFDVLEKLEGRISLEGYDVNHARIYGYLSEFLLDVYMYRNNLKPAYFYKIFIEENAVTRFKISTVRALRRIPGLANVVRAYRKSRLERHSIETDEFFINTEDIYYTSCTAVIFKPKNINFSVSSLEEQLIKLETEAKDKKRILFPRIIILFQIKIYQVLDHDFC